MDEEKNAGSARTEQETDKKCPSCGGTLSYDPAAQKLVCPFCGNSFDITPEADTILEIDFDKAEQEENREWGAETKTVICKSCGAETVYDAIQISGVCPYCGSNQVIETDTTIAMAPHGVVAFLISAKEAGERFGKWLKKKWFTPRAAKKSCKADSFKGFYLPYWTFDADTYSEYKTRYGIDRTYTDSKGNSHTTTDWYSTSGTYSRFIDDQLVRGTDRYDASCIDRVEPFKTEEAKPYKPEYIAGFASESYTTGLKDAWVKAKAKISGILSNEIADKVRHQFNADHVDEPLMTTQFSNLKYKYLLLPVWLSSFMYKGKKFVFMVNGQTGKVGGKAPVSPLRVTIAVILGLAVIALLVYFFMNSGVSE